MIGFGCPLPYGEAHQVRRASAHDLPTHGPAVSRCLGCLSEGSRIAPVRPCSRRPLPTHTGVRAGFSFWVCFAPQRCHALLTRGRMCMGVRWLAFRLVPASRRFHPCVVGHTGFRACSQGYVSQRASVSERFAPRASLYLYASRLRWSTPTRVRHSLASDCVWGGNPCAVYVPP